MASPMPFLDDALPSLTSLRVVVGYQCSFRCAFCYQEHRDGVSLDPTSLGRVLRRLPPGFAPEFVTVMGGEPTENPWLAQHITALRRAWPDAVLSVTTNGSGSLEAYRELQCRGLDNLTLSLQTLDPQRYALITRQALTTLDELLTKIVVLEDHGSVRINAYIFPDQVEAVYGFCKRHRLSLTFCEDLRARPGAPAVPFAAPPGVHLVFENDIRRIYRDADGYEFWNYKHLDRFDYDNLIVLPDGSLTLDFADIMAQRGRIGSVSETSVRTRAVI